MSLWNRLRGKTPEEIKDEEMESERKKIEGKVVKNSDTKETVIAGVFNNGAETGRISSWSGDRIKKAFTLAHTGGGGWDDFYSPGPKITELPEGWFIDDKGYLTCSFPSIDVDHEDFTAGERQAYPAYLKTAALTEWNSWSHSKMSGNAVGMRFHHWMGNNLPGFWDAFKYSGTDSDKIHKDKIFRIVFEDQGEILFYSTHGAYYGKRLGHNAENATFVVKSAEGKEFRLLYESNIADPHRDVCYPGQQDTENVSFDLPKEGLIRDNIISAFAIIHAVGRLSEEAYLKPLPISRQIETQTQPQAQHSSLSNGLS